MAATIQELANEPTETKLKNGITVITGVVLIPKETAPVSQALAMQKARRLFDRWFMEVETKITVDS